MSGILPHSRRIHVPLLQRTISRMQRSIVAKPQESAIGCQNATKEQRFLFRDRSRHHGMQQTADSRL
jgi:hypothetical protein